MLDRIIIEIKAKCNDSDRIRAILQSKGADYKGKDCQIDTYFGVNAGRLKLREGNIENFLIFYNREDKKGPKKSAVMLFQTEPNSSLKILLTKALGIHVVVEKQREIYFIDNVKFHLDKVENLGSFVEIEAINIDNSNSTKELLKQCTYFLKLFEISDEDLIEESYSDLILKKL